MIIYFRISYIRYIYLSLIYTLHMYLQSTYYCVFKYNVLIVERVYVHVMMVQGDPVPRASLQQVQLIDTPLHNHRVGNLRYRI